MSKQIPSRFRFTNRAIEALPPNDSQSKSTEKEYSDIEVSGLKMLVGKNNSKKFLLRYTWRGRKRSIALGPFGALNVADARQVANEQKGLVSRGTDPKQEKLNQKQVVTLDEYMESRYFPLYSAKKRSERSDLGRYKHHIQPVLGKMLIDEITTHHILQLQRVLMATLANATNNRVLALCKHAFHTAETTFQLVIRNPAKSIKLLLENNQRTRFLSHSEIRRLFAACDEDQNYYMGNYIKFLLLTGVRRAEAAQGKWSDVRLQAQPPTWHLPHTKNGRSRNVYLNRLAVELLTNLKHIQGNPYLFPGGYPNNETYGGPIQSPTKAFRRILKRALINDKEICIHTLRHTHGALLASSGANQTAIQFSLGHTTGRMTERYSHLSESSIELTGQQIVSCVESALFHKSPGRLEIQ